MSPAGRPRPSRAGALRRLAGAWVPRIAAIIGVGVIAYALVHSEAGTPPAEAKAARPRDGRLDVEAAGRASPRRRCRRRNPMTREEGRPRPLPLLRHPPVGQRHAVVRRAATTRTRRSPTDGRSRSARPARPIPRSALSLANVVYNATLTWANPSLVTLERQMEVPLFGERPVEMGITDRNKAAVLARLRRDARYRAKFAAAFPGQTKPDHPGQRHQGDRQLPAHPDLGRQPLRPLPSAARPACRRAQTRGKDLFFGERAECSHCHTELQPQRPDRLRRQAGRADALPQHGAVQRRRHRARSRAEHGACSS